MPKEGNAMSISSSSPAEWEVVWAETSPSVHRGHACIRHWPAEVKSYNLSSNFGVRLYLKQQDIVSSMQPQGPQQLAVITEKNKLRKTSAIWDVRKVNTTGNAKRISSSTCMCTETQPISDQVAQAGLYLNILENEQWFRLPDNPSKIFSLDGLPLVWVVGIEVPPTLSPKCHCRRT